MKIESRQLNKGETKRKRGSKDSAQKADTNSTKYTVINIKQVNKKSDQKTYQKMKHRKIRKINYKKMRHNKIN